ncbi:hypothetical protein [Algoriphagus pacificus]|uniref:Glycosyltransferase RgtA/B/C/D-like domain-containing protein n=1 Tax=Algoriphagus pacificus TaxID=2811234 RepID=A0ABS3CMS0_9BACT|nr:hypothetical protein [Algoriphagus pacificus]MBN7817540.1 hypothetical protein [Algoriphagus pacificus]
MEKNKRFNILLTFSCLFSLALILFGINKGFDWSDEGLYLLLLDPDQENFAGVYFYDLFFKLAFQGFGTKLGIIDSRVLRLLFYFLAAIFCSEFWKNLKQKSTYSWNYAVVFLLALFSGYAFLPPSLSYNSLSVVIACAWLTLISKESGKLLTHLLIGFLLALLVYVKITAAFTLGVITMGLWFWRKEFNWKSSICLILPFLILELLFYTSLNQSAINRIKNSFDIIGARPDYQWLLLIKNNLVGVFWIALIALPTFLLAIMRYANKSWNLALIVCLALIISYVTMVTQEWSHAIMIGTAAFLAWRIGKTDWRQVPLQEKQQLLVLILLPFALHFGSNVYWMRLSIHYWIFWLIGAMLLTSKEEKLIKRVGVSISFLSPVLLLSGIWIMPFSEIPLWNSNTPWEYAPGKHIYLTSEMVEVLENIKAQTIDLKDEEFIAVYRNPGWLVLLDRTSPHSPGFWDKEQLQSIYPDFPAGFKAILYFPYQELPNPLPSSFESKEYKMAQGNLILELRKNPQ